MNFLGLNSYASDEEIENEDQQGHKRKSESTLPANIIDRNDVILDEDNRELMITDDVQEETKIETILLSTYDIPESVFEGKLLVSEIPEIPTLVIQEIQGVFYNRLKELPLPSNKSPNPKTVEKISEYLDLKEANGFNLTEVILNFL
jgi:hypothetical protein